jgi:hypothetical protein
MDKNYLPEQISNMDEISLFYKWISERPSSHEKAWSLPDFKHRLPMCSRVIKSWMTQLLLLMPL